MAKSSLNEKKKKHINYLKKIGFLISYNDLDLYHGRAKQANETEDWKIKVDYDNSCNVVRDNIMGIPCLCVASYNVAEAYADGTTLGGRTAKKEVHKIVSLDDEAFIVNQTFGLPKVSNNELERFFAAIQFLAGDSLNKYVMVADNSENAVNVLIEIINSYKNRFLLSTDDEDKILNSLLNKGIEISQEEVSKIVGAYNTNGLFTRMPVETVSDFVFEQGDKRNKLKGSGEEYSLNQDLVKLIMKRNNIIGIKKKNRLEVTENIVYIFDLENVQSEEKIEKQEL